MVLPSVHNTKAPSQPGLLFHSNWGATLWLSCCYNWMHSNEFWRLHYIKTTPCPRKLQCNLPSSRKFPMGDWFIHLKDHLHPPDIHPVVSYLPPSSAPVVAVPNLESESLLNLKLIKNWSNCKNFPIHKELKQLQYIRELQPTKLENCSSKF